jgi:hypothetical protein
MVEIGKGAQREVMESSPSPFRFSPHHVPSPCLAALMQEKMPFCIGRVRDEGASLEMAASRVPPRLTQE